MGEYRMLRTQSADVKPGWSSSTRSAADLAAPSRPILACVAASSDVRQTPVWTCLEHLVRGLAAASMLSALEMAKSDRKQWRVAHRIEWAQTERPLAPFDAAVCIAGIGHHHAAKDIRYRA